MSSLRSDSATTGDRAEFGSNAAFNAAAYTLLMWVYQLSVVSGRVWWGISDAGSNSHTRFRTNDASGNLAVYVDRTTDTTYITNDTPMASGRNNLWTFLAHSFDGAGAAGEVVNIFLGTLTSAAAERTYGTTTNGAGARVAIGSNVVKLANGAGNTVSQNARFGVVGLVARKMTLVEIISWQWRPRVVPDMVWLIYPGYQGTGSITDFGGHASGPFNSTSVTGLDLADGLVLGPPFGELDWRAFVTAAAAAVTRPLPTIINQAVQRAASW